MAKFQFKLESVLRQRQVVEDQCQRELAQLLRKRMILESELRATQSAISQSKRSLATDLVGRVNLERISQFARYSGQATQRAYGIVRGLAGVETEVQRSRQRLIEASRRRQALELLRQRHYEQWLLRQERLEVARLEEVAMQQHLRKVAEGLVT